MPPIGFYAELWRSPEDDPDLPALKAKYGDRAESEVSMLQMQLLREVLTAAGGLFYTLGKIEALLAEMQVYVETHIQPWPAGEPWPEFGQGVSHPLLVHASYEFVNLLSWLRAIDERLDRRHRASSDQPRVGLLPALAYRPLRERVEALVVTFRAEALERRLANYVMHAGTVPPPLEGARLTPDHKVSLRIPDRPGDRVSTRWHLTYEEERDGLTVAREAAQAVESLVDASASSVVMRRARVEARACRSWRGGGRGRRG